MRSALVDLRPLRSSPGFRRVWIGRLVSGVGSQMTMVAVLFQVWNSTRSTVWTGAVGLAQAIPLIGLGLFAGSMLDRADRRRVYLAATAGLSLCSALLGAQGFAGHLPAAGVLALVGAQSCFGAASGPAARTFIPALLPREQVAAGLALNRISFQAAMLGGPALGGLVLGWLGVGGCYLIDAASFGVALFGAWGLPPLPREGDRPPAGPAAIVDGLAFLIGSPPVRGALLTDVAATVLSMPISLFPLVNAQRFGGDPRTLGLFLSAIAVGGMVASAFSGAFTRSPRPGLVMLGGAAAWGAALALFGLSASPWLSLAFLVVAGAADTVSVVSRSTVVQLSAPDTLRGRVSAAEEIVGQAGPDLGNMRAGLVAGATSGSIALVSGGLLCVAAAALVCVATPALRQPVTARSAPSTAGIQPTADRSG